MELSSHLPNPFKTWAAFYHMALEQRGAESTEDMVRLTEVRPTGRSESGYFTHYTAQRTYSLAYIEEQVALEEQEIKKQRRFTFFELQTLLYALDQAAPDLDPDGGLRAKLEAMRNALGDEPIP